MARRSRDEFDSQQDGETQPRSPAYYWWFLANLLGISFALLSWIFCLHIFGNPEIPRNYSILEKLGRLPEVQAFTSRSAPKALMLDPGELYGKYFGIGEQKRDRLNSLLLRNYINNFEEKSLLTYVEGQFEILEIRKLTSNDLFASGFSIYGQAMVSPDDFTISVPFPVVVEFIFPSGEPQNLEKGQRFEIKGRASRLAVLHVSRAIANEEPALKLTVVSIATNPQKINRQVTIKTLRPETINPKADLPLWD